MESLGTGHPSEGLNTEAPSSILSAKIFCTEELYKKDLHNPDNHDGVITNLEPDILECKVKWALGIITTNKASGGNGIPVDTRMPFIQELHKSQGR